MIRRTRNLCAAASLVAMLAAICAAPASAAPSPAWRVTAYAAPAHFKPGAAPFGGSSGSGGWSFGAYYVINAINSGNAPTDGGPITLSFDPPPGFVFHSDPVLNLTPGMETDDSGSATACSSAGPPVVCHFTPSHPIAPGERVLAQLLFAVPATGPAEVSAQASVSGAGAVPGSTVVTTPLTDDPVPFGIQHLETWMSGEDGGAFTSAGDHPSLFRFEFDINSATRQLVGGGEAIQPVHTLRNATATLPPGLVVNPTAAPRCSEVEFEQVACPDATAIGTASIGLDFGFPANADTYGLYNLDPPAGSPAAFGFDPVGLGFFIHVLGAVDPAHGYGLEGVVKDIPEIQTTDSAALSFFGDPSDPSHDTMRGFCNPYNGGFQTPCPTPRRSEPFLTMPTACAGPLEFNLETTFWQGGADSATSMADDADGTPQGVTDCDQLDFNPTLTARPTTNVADSPSGLDVDLQVPQSDNLNQLATSHLKKAVVTLPEGLTLNPSAANGLRACSSAQVGIDPDTGTPNGAGPNCPDASKLGTVEVRTPLLNDPLPGSVYLAKPHDNPFDSQLAIYIVIDDSQSGVIIKLAGKVQADPATGRLTTTFDNNPQLPFSEFKLNFFGGATGALRTPDTCGSYETDSSLTPWSGNAPVDYPDTYSIDQGPNGDCPASAAAQINSPSFDAGTVSPTAGKFTPFVLNLHRDDAHPAVLPGDPQPAGGPGGEARRHPGLL